MFETFNALVEYKITESMKNSWNSVNIHSTGTHLQTRPISAQRMNLIIFTIAYKIVFLKIYQRRRRLQKYVRHKENNIDEWRLAL